MGTIFRITLGKGISLGALWQQIRERLKGRYVEIWADVFEEGIFWVGDEAKAVLEEVKVAFRVLNRIPAGRITIFHAARLAPDPESLPNEQSVRARTLAGHGLGAVLVFVGDGQQMPPEEPSSPKDALFSLSKPGANQYYLWRLFRSKEDAEHYVSQKLKDDEGAKGWVASIPVAAYGELLQDTEKEDRS